MIPHRTAACYVIVMSRRRRRLAVLEDESLQGKPAAWLHPQVPGLLPGVQLRPGVFSFLPVWVAVGAAPPQGDDLARPHHNLTRKR